MPCSLYYLKQLLKPNASLRKSVTKWDWWVIADCFETTTAFYDYITLHLPTHTCDSFLSTLCIMNNNTFKELIPKKIQRKIYFQWANQMQWNENKNKLFTTDFSRKAHYVFNIQRVYSKSHRKMELQQLLISFLYPGHNCEIT